jgi:hypothetical protein
MRQTKPWKAIGMSRSSWYRLGKPAEKPKRITVAEQARMAGVSTRTHQRIERVMKADIDLAVLMLNRGSCKPGHAEWLVTNPDAHRKWREAHGLPWPVPPIE